MRNFMGVPHQPCIAFCIVRQGCVEYISPSQNTYRVEFTAKALKQLKKMDAFDAKILVT